MTVENSGWNSAEIAALYTETANDRLRPTENSIHKHYYHDPYFNSLLGDTEDKTLLHVGAANCTSASRSGLFAKLQVYADFYDVLQASLYPYPNRVASDASVFPFAENSFDTVASALVMHWIKDYEAAFKESRRVLTPGGKYVFTIANPYSFKRGTYYQDEHQQWHFKADKPFDESKLTHEMDVMLSGTIGPLRYYFRHLEVYAKAMREAGFEDVSWHLPFPMVTKLPEGNAHVHIRDGVHHADVYSLHSRSFSRLEMMNTYSTTMPLFAGFVGYKGK